MASSPILLGFVLSCFSCVCVFVTLWTVAHQAPLSMGFCRQEYWSGLPFPSPIGPITSWQIDGEIMTDFIFLGSKITADGDCNHEIKRPLLPGRKAMMNIGSILKSRDITLPTKVCLVKAMVFPVAMYGSETWTIKKAECQRIGAFELWCWRGLKSSLDCKEIKPVHPKGNKSWIFIGRTDAEAEVPIFWPPYVKNWLFRKDPDAGKDWRQEEKGTTEDEMVVWHHQLDGHEFERASGVCDGQGSPACYSPWVCKESDMTERLNWTGHIYATSILTLVYFLWLSISFRLKSYKVLHDLNPLPLWFYFHLLSPLILFQISAWLSSSLYSTCHLNHDLYITIFKKWAKELNTHFSK